MERVPKEKQLRLTSDLEIRIHTCIRIGIDVHLCERIHTYPYPHPQPHTFRHLHTTSLHLHIRIHSQSTQTDTFSHIYTYIHIHTYPPTPAYSHTHPHTHTEKKFSNSELCKAWKRNWRSWKYSFFFYLLTPDFEKTLLPSLFFDPNWKHCIRGWARIKPFWLEATRESMWRGTVYSLCDFTAGSPPPAGYLDLSISWKRLHHRTVQVISPQKSKWGSLTFEGHGGPLKLSSAPQCFILMRWMTEVEEEKLQPYLCVL